MIDGTTLKKAERKVYSAVVLSIKTSIKDLYMASTGCFYVNIQILDIGIIDLNSHKICHRPYMLALQSVRQSWNVQDDRGSAGYHTHYCSSRCSETSQPFGTVEQLATRP